MPGPLGSAFNGETGAFVPVTCDLSAFAGQAVVLSFRLVTDGSFFLDGMWIDDIAVGGTELSDGSTLEGWVSPTEFNPLEVESYTVRLVANRALVQLYASGQHIPIYNKWIGRIGIKPSPMLAAMYQLNTLPE